MTPDVWQAVLVESIKGAAAVLVAVIGVGLPAWRKLRRIGRSAEAAADDAALAREQVKNDHGTNLRDDVDELKRDVLAIRRASEMNREWVGSLATEVRHLTEAIERERRPRRRRA